MNALSYRVSEFRDAGLEAKWSRNRSGAPIILARDPNANHEHQRTGWWAVTGNMFADMKTEGVRNAFARHTLIADIFSIAS